MKTMLFLYLPEKMLAFHLALPAMLASLIELERIAGDFNVVNVILSLHKVRSALLELRETN